LGITPPFNINIRIVVDKGYLNAIMNRREFIASTCAFCGAAVLGVSLLESCKKSGVASPQNVNFTLDLSSSSNAVLNTKGGSVIQDNVVVICTAPSVFVALSAICTHAGCTVAYNSSRNELICPCHGGTYSISGSVVSGPPPSGLTSYKTSLNGKTLTVT
jgi:cytochrome b6-f complex iron-sulfur subunit